VSLPIYITPSEATRRYRVSRGALTRPVKSGSIRAVKIDGGVAVADRTRSVRSPGVPWASVLIGAGSRVAQS
jgi:hypothetical protein